MTVIHPETQARHLQVTSARVSLTRCGQMAKLLACGFSVNVRSTGINAQHGVSQPSSDDTCGQKAGGARGAERGGGLCPPAPDPGSALAPPSGPQGCRASQPSAAGSLPPDRPQTRCKAHGRRRHKVVGKLCVVLVHKRPAPNRPW